MIQTVGVYHIGIPVDNLDRAEHFYNTILGMRGGHRIAEGGSRLKCTTQGELLPRL